VTKKFSVPFKQEMVQRLTGKKALSAAQLARETGLRQQSLSRWLQEARNLPSMTDKAKPTGGERTVERKAQVLAEAANLDGAALTGYLEREGVKFAEYEQWRIALDEGGAAATSTNRRIRYLERELARKEKALAEAAALLLLKKKWNHCTGRTRTATRTGRARSDARADRAGTGGRRASGTSMWRARHLGSDHRALAC